MVQQSEYIEFFDAYQKIRLEHNFRPEFIFNIDETMINVGKDKRKVIVFKDKPDPVYADATKLEHMTLLLTIPQFEPPNMGKIRSLLIVPRKTFPPLDPTISSYYDISGCTSGWINGEILKSWMENQFLQQIYQRREIVGERCPVLVILDNHSSRGSIDHDFMWNEHQLKFLFIPPHTSHVIQQLDLLSQQLSSYRSLYVIR